MKCIIDVIGGFIPNRRRTAEVQVQTSVQRPMKFSNGQVQGTRRLVPFRRRGLVLDLLPDTNSKYATAQSAGARQDLLSEFSFDYRNW